MWTLWVHKEKASHWICRVRLEKMGNANGEQSGGSYRKVVTGLRTFVGKEQGGNKREREGMAGGEARQTGSVVTPQLDTGHGLGFPSGPCPCPASSLTMHCQF